MKLPELFTKVIVLSVLMLACSKKEPALKIVVKNTLDIERNFETIELSKSFLKLETLENYGIKDAKTNVTLTSQGVDNNSDGIIDVLLFQPIVKANSESRYIIVQLLETKKLKKENICYSRFVPERTDDYAWENNKVAFRVFGPNAQFRFENNLEEGTLSSGVDAWLKKVEYPIINSWYKKYSEKLGSYHEDTGEGLDNFHVGKSRGVGGMAIKKDTSYYFSKNFISYKTITTGPIRTSFYLDYGTWQADGTLIKESKIISLDYGSNLSKFETFIEGVSAISAGITLHENNGKVTFQNNTTWINYWQPHADSHLGTAIITTPTYYAGFEKFETEEKDLSNAYIHLNIKDGKTIYYAGFTWQKSNQFKNQRDWEIYLSNFTKKLKTPLEVKISY